MISVLLYCTTTRLCDRNLLFAVAKLGSLLDAAMLKIVRVPLRSADHIGCSFGTEHKDLSRERLISISKSLKKLESVV